MKLLDVNILVPAHRDDADQHAVICQWLTKALEQPSGIAVSELVLSGTLRIITHPKIFKEPTPLEMALEYIESDEYLEITPDALRLRKIWLRETERKRNPISA